MVCNTCVVFGHKNKIRQTIKFLLHKKNKKTLDAWKPETSHIPPLGSAFLNQKDAEKGQPAEEKCTWEFLGCHIFCGGVIFSTKASRFIIHVSPSGILLA